MRQNLATNYTFLNGDLTGWSAENGATRSYTTDYAFYGDGALLVAKGAANASGVVMNQPISVQAGKSYAISMYARLPLSIPESDPAVLSLTVTWANSAGTVVGTNTSGSLVLDDDSQWYRLSGVWNAPAGATVISSVRIFQPVAGREGQQFILDAMLVEQASYVGGFFFTHSQAEKYRLAQKALSRVPQVINGLRLGADISLNNLTFNTIDEFGTIWVVENITGWDGQTSPEMPDIGRGTDDGSYDVEGRLTSRGITLSGFFIPADPDQALTDTKDRLVEAINLVRKGGWLRAHSEPTRAAWVRLSGAPSIVTQNDRGRTQFAISLRAPDPIKYHWDDSDTEGFTGATARSSDIPDEQYTNLITNPSFETAGNLVEIFRNQFTNPSFEATSAIPVEVRRNLVRYSDTTSTTGWTPTSGVSTVESGRLKLVQNTTNPVRLGYTTALTDPITAGSYVVSYRMQTSEASAVTGARVYLYDSVSATIRGSQTIPLVAGGGDTKYEFSITTTGDTNVLYIEAYGTSIPAGVTVYFSEPLLEAGTVQRPFFNGSFRPQVRRNLALNPRAIGSGGSGWVSNSVSTNPLTRGVTPPVSHPLGITTAAEQSSTGTNSALVTLYNIDSLLNTGTPARTVSAWVLVTEAGYNSYGIDLPANVWTFVQGAQVASGAHAGFYVNKTTGNASTTVRAYVTGALVEEGSAFLGSYFDGSTTPPTGYTNAWTGTPNLSSSYRYDLDFTPSWSGAVGTSDSLLTAVGYSGLNTARCYAIRSTHWKKDGTYSLRVIPNSSTGAAAVTIGSMPLNATQLVWSWLEAPLTGTIDAHAMTLRRASPVVQDQRPNTTGEYKHRLVSNGVSSNNLELWGVREGGGDIWFDMLTVVNGEYPGDVFGGNSSPDTDLTASWSGVADNSQAVLSGFVPTGVNSASGCVAIRSSQWAKSGSYSLRVISTSAGEGASYVILSPGANTTARGTVRASMYRFAPQTDRGYSHYGKIYWNPVPQPMSPRWLTTGVNEAEIYGPIQTEPSTVVLVHGGRVGDPDVFVDDFFRVEGVYTGPTFTGDTPDIPGTSYEWLGTPGASASVKSVWLTDYIDNIGNATVSALFTVTGPAGPGTKIHNSLTNETITLAEPLRGKSVVGSVIKMASLNGVATLTTDRYSGLRPGDKINLVGLPVPFTTPGQVYEVTASSDVFPYSFSFEVASDDIDETNVSGQVSLDMDDVLTIDTYEKSVTYNGEKTGHRYRLTTLTDWVRFGPGKNPVEFFDDALQVNVTNKQVSGTTVQLQTEDIHYLQAGDKILVALPTVADLSKKSLAANVVTITTATPHGFAAGDTVDVVSVESSEVNYKARASNVVTLTTVGEHGISVNDYITVSLPVTATPTSKQLTSNVATITTLNAHGYSVGDQVVVALPVTASVSAKQLLQNVVTLTTVGSHGYATGDSITVSMPVSSPVVKKERIGALAYITTSGAHGFSVGDKVVMSLPESATAVGTFDGVASTNLVVVNAVGHGFSIGDRITVTGSSRPSFNGEKIVETIPSNNTFTFRDWTLTTNVATTAAGTTITNLTNQTYNGTKTVVSSSGATFAYNV